MFVYTNFALCIEILNCKQRPYFYLFIFFVVKCNRDVTVQLSIYFLPIYKVITCKRKSKEFFKLEFLYLVTKNDHIKEHCLTHALVLFKLHQKVQQIDGGIFT